MRPIKLSLQGINSFEDRQEIDFEKLTSMGLFGIFGKTGSGKSTIIDAITLVLYGKLSRYDGNSYCPFINTNCDSAYVGFEFEILENGQPVRIVAEREYKKKETEKSKKEITDDTKRKYGTRTSFLRLYKKVAEETIIIADKNETEMTKAIIDLIGLTYDDFLKTVILPQGKFSGFLMLENKERRDMLERIFRLDKYGENLHTKVKESLNRSNNELIVLSQTKKKYENISEEVLLNEKNNLHDIIKTLDELQSQSKETQSELNKYKQWNEENKECLLYESQKKERDSQKHDIENKREKTVLAKKAILIKPIFDDLENAEHSLNEKTDMFQKQKNLFEAESQNQISIKKQYDIAIKNKNDNYLPLINKENELKQAIIIADEISKLQEERKTLQLEYIKIDKTLSLVSEDIKANGQNKQELITKLNKIEVNKREIYIDAHEKQKVFDLYNKNKELQTMHNAMLEYGQRADKLEKDITADTITYDSLKLEQADIIKLLDENKTELDKLISKCPGDTNDTIRINNDYTQKSNELALKKQLGIELDKLIADKIEVKAILSDLTIEKESLSNSLNSEKVQLGEIKEQIKAFEQNNIVSLIAENLNAGEACPVCGSKEHPNIAEKIADSIINGLKEKAGVLENKIITDEKKEKNLDIAIINHNKDIETLEKAINDRNISIGDFDITLFESGLDKIKQQLDNLIDAIKKWELQKITLEESIKDRTNISNAIEVKIALLNERINKNKEIKSELDININKLSDDKIILEESIMILKYELSIENGIDNIYNDIKSNEILMEKLDIDEKNTRQKIEMLEKEMVDLSAKMQGLEKNREIIITSGKEKKLYIEQKEEKIKSLSSAGLDPKEELISVQIQLKTIIDTEERLKNKVEQIDREIKQIEELKIGLENQIGILLNRKNDLEIKVRQALDEYGFENKQEYINAYIEEDILHDIENDIKKWDEDILKISDNLDRLYIKLKDVDRENIENIYIDLEQRYTVTSAQISEKIAEKGGCEERIINIESLIKESEQLEKQIKKTKHRNDLLSQLGKLFQGKRFVEFVAVRQLRPITIEASKWLGDMSRGRYAIELDDASFVIRDDFNGGNMRPPTTLSGGEIFMVSLSLALALSTKVQMKNNTPLDFFFLDEGFGTLDAAVLDTVMKCLEMLKAEGMNIGIISHVEELKNRIDKKLIVEKAEDGMGGTRAYIE